MATLHQIQARLKELGLQNDYGYRRETRLLPNVLEADEQLLAVTSGVLNGMRRLVVLTERRLLFVSKPTMGEPRLFAVPREDLVAVRGSKGLVFGSLSFETADGTYRLDNVLKKSMAQFAPGMGLPGASNT
ncbi:MAG: PH domain-containing protein [Spirochaetia bacterium]